MRQGKRTAAAACYREAIRLSEGYAEAHCNLGSVLFQQGRFVESLEAYRRGHVFGSARRDWNYPSAEWVRQAERKAELEKKLTDVVEGNQKPPGSDERIELATIAVWKRLFRVAARLYAEGFTEKPALAEDRQAGHRYTAAEAAARAGCGIGEDDAKPDEKARASLRSQALGWLRRPGGLGERGGRQQGQCRERPACAGSLAEESRPVRRARQGGAGQTAGSRADRLAEVVDRGGGTGEEGRQRQVIQGVWPASFEPIPTHRVSTEDPTWRRC